METHKFFVVLLSSLTILGMQVIDIFRAYAPDIIMGSQIIIGILTIIILIKKTIKPYGNNK